MLQLWQPFTGAYEKVGIQLRGVLDWVWNYFFQNWLTFYLFVWKDGRKKGKKNSKTSILWLFLGHPMFGTSVGN